ncbi:hypothetical protein [Sphingomonas sp.]|uniref:hypothetical protein n=1 Tax=Sphingomonas sp. TaxID=28214 RepID=UPI00286CDE5A|nr:hypothetical protein [Sphingomonas sp.]
MPDEFHANYFAGRELDERAMSERATDPRAAAAHIELAEHYQAMALVFGAKPATSTPTVA